MDKKKLLKNIWFGVVLVAGFIVFEFIFKSCVVIWLLVIIYLKENGSNVTSLANNISIWIQVVSACLIILIAYVVQRVLSNKGDNKSKRTVRIGFNLKGKKK